MLDEEKQLIRIIKRIRFIVENNLGLFLLWIILELAIIINAAIIILKIINVEDMESINENDEIE
jgi:hypothetical protein